MIIRKSVFLSLGIVGFMLLQSMPSSSPEPTSSPNNPEPTPSSSPQPTSSPNNPEPTPSSSPQPTSSPNNPEQSADRLKKVALRAANEHPLDCAKSVATAAEMYGIHDLPPKNANNQIAYMRENWRKVSADEAIQLANQGIFVVAGMTGKELKDTHGHLAVVAPGGGIKKGNHEYPALIGGALNPKASSVKSMNHTPDGRISVRWAFPSKAVDKDMVDYRTP
jgi:hypothetical protein